MGLQIIITIVSATFNAMARRTNTGRSPTLVKEQVSIVIVYNIQSVQVSFRKLLCSLPRLITTVMVVKMTLIEIVTAFRPGSSKLGTCPLGGVPLGNWQISVPGGNKSGMAPIMRFATTSEKNTSRRLVVALIV